MPKIFTSKSQRSGEMGEKIASLYLMRHGFQVLERNYTKKCGELDIIAKKGSMTHFIEVKSQSARFITSGYRPEENMHHWKIERLKKTIRLYLQERRGVHSWQFDLIVVYRDDTTSTAKVDYMPNIIL